MDFVDMGDRVMRRVARYHQHQVEGMDAIPDDGPALIVVNHSLATYDSGLLVAAIRAGRGRDVRMLGDRYMFKIPIFRDLATAYGFVEGSQENAERLLENGEIVLVAPGGMREALKPSSRKYQLDIADRKGFVRLAVRNNTPVILSACPAADDLYHVVSNPVTDWVYTRHRLAAPLFFGRFGTPVPRPVRLVHYLSEPIRIPANCAGGDSAAIDAFHALLQNRLQDMLDAYASS